MKRLKILGTLVRPDGSLLALEIEVTAFESSKDDGDGDDDDAEQVAGAHESDPRVSGVIKGIYKEARGVSTPPGKQRPRATGQPLPIFS